MKTNVIIPGEFIPGVFCAYEGTMVMEDEFYEELFEHLKDLSVNKKIHLFTEGNPKDLEDFLVSKNLQWEIIQMENFAGAQFEIVFSSGTYRTFREKYKIIVESYNRTYEYA